jgi:hypothetical protein
MHPRPLTERQRRFVEFRIRGYQQTVAARLAGYRDTGSGSIKVLAHEMEHHHPGIRAAREELENALCLDGVRRLQQGRSVEMSTLALVMEWKGASPKMRARAASILGRMLYERDPVWACALVRQAGNVPSGAA